jgi:hypothetical protein
MYEPFGRLVLGVLLLQDALVLMSIPLVTELGEGPRAALVSLGSIAVLAVLALLVRRRVAPLLLRIANDQELLLLTALATLFGWAPAGALVSDDVPGATTPWQVESGDELTETTPLTLRWDNGKGLIFRQTYAVDANYMFTLTQSVENDTGAEVRLQPYGTIARHGKPSDLKNFYILHEGAIRMADGRLEAAPGVLP